MDEDRDAQRGFKVTDRRRFSEAGEARDDAPAEPPAAEPPSRSEASAPSSGAAQTGAAEPSLHTFESFILGLSTQALLHLGEIPNPVTNAVERDLPAAKQVIDILGILRDKTRNNLEQGEQSLLESVLYDLRMRYVELLRPGTKGA